MDLKSKFYTIFKALNPYNYKELAESKFSQVLKFYLFIILISVVIMSIMFIPFLYYTGSYISENVGHFDNLTVNSDFKLKESFNILSDPVIRFDTENKNMTNEMVLITPDLISYKHYLFFGKERSIPLIHGVNVVDSARAKALISLGVFFLLPSLFFWVLIFSIIYFGIIILITYILVLIITGLLRMNLNILRLLKLCIYAATIFILLQLLLMPFFRIFWLPLTAYWLLVLIILFLWRDDSFKENQSVERSGASSHHGSKTKDIFGDKSESGFKSGHKTPVQDEYDVDANGNIKGTSGSSKKHKHSDEDDGYVEL